MAKAGSRSDALPISASGKSARQCRDLNCISLFVGGGGLSLGLEKAGFRTILATDIDDSAAQTFAANKPSTPFIHRDVRRISREEILSIVGDTRVHLVAGGPPCQGFSTLGDQLVGDPRNTLFEAFRRVVEWVRPECFLMENVAYLRSQYDGRFEQEIVRAFEEAGYRVSVNTLNAADFGVPQIRKRVMFVGTRREFEFEWPVPTHAEDASGGKRIWKTVGESIMDLVGAHNGNAPPNHLVLRHSERVVQRYRLIPEGGRLPPPADLPAEIRRKNFGNTYKRLHREKPSLTLVPGNNAFPVHPTLDRSLTPREAARLQTFPDDYVFMGNRSQQCRLVGNAVPVELARAVGGAIRDHLTTTKASSSSTSKIVAPRGQLPLPFSSRVDERPVGRQKTAVSFFTGVGGLALGFMNSGFKVLASYDKKQSVDRNIKLNFPDMPHYHRDVSELTAQDLLKDLGGRGVDVVFGGSPCQGFSIFGNRRFVNTRGHNPEKDERNELAISYIRLAVALRPRAILLENVKGITSTPRGKGTYVDEIERMLRKAGYDPEWRILNCADFGVPQLRERFVLIAVQRGIEFRWPKPKHHAEPKPWQRPYVTVGDVITDLMDPSTISEDFSHMPMNHKPLVVARYKLIPEGGRLPDGAIPEELRKGYRSDNVRNYSHVYRRLAMDQPATTMVPGHNAFPIHPRLHRTLTAREAARIQTFPDNIRFAGTRQQQCTLVGNAVPPLLASILAQAIRKALDCVYATPGYNRDIYDLQAGAAQ